MVIPIDYLLYVEHYGWYFIIFISNPYKISTMKYNAHFSIKRTCFFWGGGCYISQDGMARLEYDLKALWLSTLNLVNVCRLAD